MFQKTFIDTIANLIYQAYSSGVLQYHSMTITDITVTMTMFTHFNQLAFQFNGRMLSISMYDTDRLETQLSSILNVLNDLIS